MFSYIPVVWPWICSVCRTHHSILILIHDLSRGLYQELTRRVPHVEHELLSLQEHQNSHPVFNGVHAALSLGFCVMFCRSLFGLLSLFLPLLYCLSSFRLRFWLPLWYLQTYISDHAQIKSYRNRCFRICHLFIRRCLRWGVT